VELIFDPNDFDKPIGLECMNLWNKKKSRAGLSRAELTEALKQIADIVPLDTQAQQRRKKTAKAVVWKLTRICASVNTHVPTAVLSVYNQATEPRPRGFE
jgi:hypothetical protein